MTDSKFETSTVVQPQAQAKRDQSGRFVSSNPPKNGKAYARLIHAMYSLGYVRGRLTTYKTLNYQMHPDNAGTLADRLDKVQAELMEIFGEPSGLST